MNSLASVSVVVKAGAVTEEGAVNSAAISVVINPAPISAPAVTVVSNQKDVTVDSSTPPTTITIPQGVNDATISVAPLVSGAGGQRTATVNAVIEGGYGDVPLTFDKAVRILIPGQAGRDAGYYRNGAFTKITTILNADTQAAGDGLSPGGDGKIDVGNDLVIWTKHFTKFVSYAQSPADSGGGGGGGAAPAESVSGGTVAKNGVIIAIPAGAVAEDIRVKVEKAASAAGLPVAAGSRLVSEVFEITKDKSGSFAKPLTITLVFDRSKVDAEKHSVSIYWFEEGARKWVELQNVKVELEAGKVSGEVSHFTKLAVIATEKKVEKPAATLKDISGHWAQGSITRLVSSGAISGYPYGTFRPDGRITRAEFATVLVKAFGLQQSGGKVFSDTADHWARDYISTAAFYGIVSGYSQNTFGPDDQVTREQMAVMIVKAARLKTETEGTVFTDGADISGWASGAVSTAVKKGIMKGYPDGGFKPKGQATRAEAVTVIVHALK